MKWLRTSFLLLLCAGLIESISGFLLTMLAGEYFSSQFHDGTKHQLLNRIGLYINHNQLISWFFTCLVFRVISGFLFKSWSHVLTDKILASQIEDSEPGFLVNSSLRSLIRKGVFEAIRDLIFFSTGFLLLGMISLPIFLVTILVFALLMGFQFIVGKRQAQVFQRYRKENRRLRTKLDMQLKNAVLEQSSNFAKQRSMLNVVSAMGVFLSIGLNLWMIDSQWVQINTSQGLMSFLVLLQLQGTMRRLLGLPGYYHRGWKSLKKSGLISKFGSRRTQALQTIWLPVLLSMMFSY